MANFYWVGGYTGGTGENTGFQSTGASGGTFGGPVWKNLTPYSNPGFPSCGTTLSCDPNHPDNTGLTGYGWTSTVGDLWFSPYYWGNTQNWRVEINLPTIVIYDTPTVLPQGGDIVIFQGPSLRNPNGTQVSPYNYSCLWGGMSGDAHTASGSTAWIRVAGQTATNQFGHINYFSVKDDWKAGVTPTSAIWPGTTHSISQGNIGYGGNTFGMWTQTIPLNINVDQWIYINTDTIETSPINKDVYQQQYVCMNNIKDPAVSYTNITYPRFNISGSYYTPDQNPLHVHRGVYMIKGNWQSVVSNSGTLFTDAIVNDGTLSYFNGGGVAYTTSNTCQWAYFNCNKTLNTSYAWGNVDGYVYGFFVTHEGSHVVIGDISGIGHSAPNWTQVNLSNYSQTFPVVKPRVTFGACTIHELFTENGPIQIGVHENLTRYESVIVRDGRLGSSVDHPPQIGTGPGKDVVLNMRHPTNSLWQQFIIGLSPSDDGLSIGNPNVEIIGFDGCSFKTAYPIDVFVDMSLGITGPTGAQCESGG